MKIKVVTFGREHRHYYWKCERCGRTNRVCYCNTYGPTSICTVNERLYDDFDTIKADYRYTDKNMPKWLKDYMVYHASCLCEL